MAETPENTPDDETPAAEPEAPVGPPADGGPAEDGAVEGSPASPETTAPPEPPKDPKERRAARRASSRGSAGAGTPRTPEERQAERDAARRAKAAARRRRRPRERERAKARRSGRPTPPPQHGVGRPKVRQGIVTSDKADKTIVVRIDVARRHQRYEKIVRSSSSLHAHDEANDAHEGDTVRVIESRPLSATKRWRLVEVLERAR
jgi:small subunit ribosomal protein S17